MFQLPTLYPILDAETCKRRGLDLFEVARVWADAGVGIVQYRDKQAPPDEALRNAEKLTAIFDRNVTRLVMNDSPERARQAGWDTAHIGQEDDLVETARVYVPYIGISTHNEAQVIAADGSTAAYVAIGPVFSTTTKQNASPVFGLVGVERARALTSKPLVAIGGITLSTVHAVRAVGADSVAVISALLEGGSDAVAKNIRMYLAAAG